MLDDLAATVENLGLRFEAFGQPMLATLVSEPFDKPGWVYEDDGDRIVAYKEEDQSDCCPAGGVYGQSVDIPGGRASGAEDSWFLQRLRNRVGRRGSCRPYGRFHANRRATLSVADLMNAIAQWSAETLLPAAAAGLFCAAAAFMPSGARGAKVSDIEHSGKETIAQACTTNDRDRCYDRTMRCFRNCDALQQCNRKCCLALHDCLSS